MRKIKFRAWDKKSRRMVSTNNLMVDATGLLLWQFGYNYPTPLPEEEWEEMQFTGLRDKHGTEIYEGDVVYVAGQGNMVIEFPFLDLYDAMPEGDIGGIIGNVHENPELLEA